MTTKGRYRNDFAAPPLPPRSPSPVGARRLQVDHQGRRRAVEIDPDAFICRRLVTELAGAVAGMHEAMNLSWGALQRLAASAKNLAGYIDQAVPDPIGIRCHTLTVDVLEGWQSWLRRSHSASSDMPGERASEVFRLLRWLDAHSEVPVSAGVVARVRGPVTYPRARAGNVDEFSAPERVAEDAARQDVERLKRNLSLARRTEGPLGELIAGARAGELTATLVRQGFGPRWETLPAELSGLIDRRVPPPVTLDDAALAVITEVFALHAQGWPAAEIASTLNNSGRATRRGGPWTIHAVRHVLARRYAEVPASLEHTSRSQATRERQVRDWSPEELVEAVHRLVWPHELDLVGVVVLLGLRTGLPPECIKDLSIGCVTGSDRRFATIEYVKRRGRGRSSLRVPNQGEFAPARLVELVFAATAETRALLAGEATERLFVCGSRHYGVLRARAADFQGTFERWCHSHRLEVAPPFDLRRLRKTRKVARALALRGSVTDIADDHTTQVARRHYLQTTTLQVLSADVIRGIQLRITEEVTTGPVVVPPAAEAVLATDTRAAAAAGMRPATARAVIAGRLDVGLASCRDVRSSPFAEAGELCPAAFGGSCLWCPNAIITERSLPALLLFCDHIDDQRRDLPPPTWNERWGPTVHRIRDEILPAFPETAVSEARVAADADREALHLPATMTARSRR
jgi:hypothetical protein